jgi:hypothetical protein
MEGTKNHQLAQKLVFTRLWLIQNMCHPNCSLIIDMPDFQSSVDALNCFLEGGLTQIMVKRGDLLVVHYTQNYNVQALFDAYGRD